MITESFSHFLDQRIENATSPETRAGEVSSDSSLADDAVASVGPTTAARSFDSGPGNGGRLATCKKPAGCGSRQRDADDEDDRT